jgi:hypothetical protein
MKKFIITEEEKDEILGQHNNVKTPTNNPKRERMLDIDITSMNLIKFKSQGLTPYYFHSELGDKFGLVELTSPIKQNYNTIPKEIFLLKPDEYSTVVKMTENIKEMIDLKKKQIELIKQYIPAVAAEIIKKK